jgi:hypothetical protein
MRLHLAETVGLQAVACNTVVNQSYEYWVLSTVMSAAATPVFLNDEQI